LTKRDKGSGGTAGVFGRQHPKADQFRYLPRSNPGLSSLATIFVFCRNQSGPFRLLNRETVARRYERRRM
jgi:hypothetical protein